MLALNHEALNQRMFIDRRVLVATGAKCNIFMLAYDVAQAMLCIDFVKLAKA